MSYQVLARKWRPQTFSEIVGQEYVLAVLLNSLSLKRIHHAYLFSGTRGVGKTSIARLLAKGLNCENGITPTPCGVCDNCRDIEKGRFVDLIEIDAASQTKVEDTRDLLENIQYSSTRGRFKIYLIDEVHMLSRHSFNALLKTLEEPPDHVKFLLATTDPQKLPITILSRCLQLHLKTLEVDQIRTQLGHILQAEDIIHEPRALWLLARSANGSMRDALNLTDQAIAIGNGKLATESVSIMLGTLDDDQALSLIESIIHANGERTLSLINEAASRGIEWEALLVDMLSLFHRLAMLQLSSSAIGVDMASIEEQLRELARTVPPTEIQLYYQTLLIGRKELPFAPDRRMGVEMTLLRALAFHPHTPLLPELETPIQSFSTVTPTEEIIKEAKGLAKPMSPLNSELPLVSDSTSLILAARSQLQNGRGGTKPKKNESPSPKGEGMIHKDAPPNECLSSVAKRAQFGRMLSSLDYQAQEEKTYHWKAPLITEEVKVEATTQKAMNKVLEIKKTPEMEKRLMEEVILHDSWALEISQLQLPTLVEQAALNSWKEQRGNQVHLHFRPGQGDLNSIGAKKILTDALSALQGVPIELTFIENDNSAMRTPMEWRQVIYEEKLLQAREMIISDNNIQTLLQFFDANLDEESIQPL